MSARDIKLTLAVLGFAAVAIIAGWIVWEPLASIVAIVGVGGIIIYLMKN